jgi:hypothetical protein
MRHAAYAPPSTVRYFGPGVHCLDSQPGDLILTETDDLFAKVIRFGERIRMHGTDRVFAKVNHAMIALGDGTVVEMASGGGRITPLAAYKHLAYAVVHVTNATDAQRAAAVSVAKWHEGIPYGFPSIASDSFYLLTGLPIALTVGQSVVCSAMAASTMRCMNLIPAKPDIAVLPCDLALYFNVRLP